MSEETKRFKHEIAVRRKKFVALLFGVLLGLLPSVTVMAETIRLTGEDPEIPFETIKPGDVLEWDYPTESGTLKVTYYVDGQAQDADPRDECQDHYEGQNICGVEIRNCGIQDLDHYSKAKINGAYKEYQLNGNRAYLTVYLGYPDPEYKVTFDPNGSPDKAVEKTTVDQKVSVFPAFEYEGYEFLGFFTAKEGGEEWTVDKKFTEDTILYAHWKKGDDPGPKPGPKPKHKKGGGAGREDDVKPAVFNPYALNAHYYVNNVIDYKAILGRVEQGPGGKAAFAAALPAGWNLGFSFSMSYDGKNEYSLKNGIIKLYVPQEFQKAGRKYAIMAIDKNGKVSVIYDADTLEQLVTVSPNVEGYAYELIYKD